eukprot:15472928-Alexandrium_andersonii.AAC.1
MARFAGRFGICANTGAESTRQELQGPILRPCLGPRSSRFERLDQFRHVQFSLALFGSISSICYS